MEERQELGTKSKSTQIPVSERRLIQRDEWPEWKKDRKLARKEQVDPNPGQYKASDTKKWMTRIEKKGEKKTENWHEEQVDHNPG